MSGEKITEIDEEEESIKKKPSLLEGEWGPEVPHHRCQETRHY